MKPTALVLALQKTGRAFRSPFVFRLANKGAERPGIVGKGWGPFAAPKHRRTFFMPITNVGRIATLEQKKLNAIRPSALTLAAGPAGISDVDNVSVEFVQGSATTGSRIGVSVSNPEPLSEDLRLVLRLVPGSGDNPAVSGEDFVDTPHDVTIEAGELSADVWIQLLQNGDMQTARSLAVEVSLAE